MKHIKILRGILSIALVLIMFISLSACESNTEQTIKNDPVESDVNDDPLSDDGSDTPAPNKILVAFFSRTGENYSVGVIEKGNTDIIAEMIADKTDADIFEITPETPYPDSYDECVTVAQKEKDENARPKFKGGVENMDEYGIVFLGFPVWCSDMPMVLYTFLESYDFSGKSIIPFCTHEGSGLSDIPLNISKTCSKALVSNGFEIRGSIAQNEPEKAKEELTAWLEKNHLI